MTQDVLWKINCSIFMNIALCYFEITCLSQNTFTMPQMQQGLLQYQNYHYHCTGTTVWVPLSGPVQELHSPSELNDSLPTVSFRYNST